MYHYSLLPFLLVLLLNLTEATTPTYLIRRAYIKNTVCQPPAIYLSATITNTCYLNQKRLFVNSSIFQILEYNNSACAGSPIDEQFFQVAADLCTDTFTPNYDYNIDEEDTIDPNISPFSNAYTLISYGNSPTCNQDNLVNYIQFNPGHCIPASDGPTSSIYTCVGNQVNITRCSTTDCHDCTSTLSSISTQCEYDGTYGFFLAGCYARTSSSPSPLSVLSSSLLSFLLLVLFSFM
eukprot:TRINITY_DN2462_c0_g1_i2.p1 TRINITY_DN2462_c0_g1~~TRINITY_DN2462_c0_g1_i2.p1  ORF type:complete len:236 (-),score=49.14 TRINITY_DN2462_c0_g1_i2:44-751(-)